ncbi:MAG: hypothetical protein LBB45_09010 [Methanobrevibacter sp.]|jgi:hypothetical protein|nr:hypothetical protein [Candidatus Methanovirga basalitermitum]
MKFEIKHAILKRDSVDESFELIDPKNHFKNDEYLVGIDSDTLIGMEIILSAILNNDFKNWDKIKENDQVSSFSNLLLKLGYKKEEIEHILNEI